MNVQLSFCVWRVECPETDSVVLTARHEFVGGGGKRNAGYRFCVASVVADVRVVMGGEVTNRIFFETVSPCKEFLKRKPIPSTFVLAYSMLCA